MTLIAAFRCDLEGRPAVVVCADSQETADAYIVEVKKIQPREAGAYELIIGGSGYIAPLIDGQANAIEQGVKRWPARLDEESARLRLEQILRAYNAQHVKDYPVEVPPDIPEYKVLRFIVCARDKAKSQIYLWRVTGTAAARVDDYAMVGWEEAAYHYEAEWLYRPGMSAAQAILLGVHLFTVADKSLYIGGPTQVIVVGDNGMRPQPPEDTQAIRERVKAFNGALAKLVLACPDTGLHQDKFKELILKFADEAMEMRHFYTLQAAALSIARALADPDHHGDVIHPIPPGVNVAVHTEDPVIKARLQEVSDKTRERLKRRREREEAPPSDSEKSEGQP